LSRTFQAADKLFGTTNLAVLKVCLAKTQSEYDEDLILAFGGSFGRDVRLGEWVLGEPPQHNPEEPIRSSKSRLRTPLPQDRKLLPERQVFQEKFAARAKEVNSQNEQMPQQGQPETDSTWRQATLGPPVICLI
jgi:hypothetical protein